MKFELSAGGTHEFELAYSEDSSIPEKLGDGNFGIVFKANDGAGPLAVKFIYLRQATDVSGSTADADFKLTRILDELEVTSRITETLRIRSRNSNVAHKLLNSFSDHLVLPKSFCKDLSEKGIFKDDPNGRAKFQKAKVTLESMDIFLSPYAYVMDQFDCSLKDLVEGSARSKKGSYRGLEDTPMIERERSALFVMQGVARGLKVLHIAGLRHQDIKPANIYYKGDDTDVDFRLGDLGFLRPQSPVEAGSGMVPSHALAIGTKHYRSIEQIDFSDTSEVGVEIDKDSQSAKLVSRDPKFIRTNIGKSDLVYFPKSNTQRLFVIQEISKNESEGVTTVIIKVPNTTDRDEDGAGMGVIFDDDNTQVSFVKNPTAKTDLFGLGGILFDIISAGDSPERLYDLLRKFDRPGSSISDQIISYYSIWQADQFVDPAVSAIFQRVQGESSVSVSEATLTFLLRCCMSEPEDSFYNKFGFSDLELEETAWDKVLAAVTELIDHLDASTYSRIDVNCLTGKPQGVPAPRQVPRLLLNYIPVLTGSGRTQEHVEKTSIEVSKTDRYLRGIRLIEKLSERMCFLTKQNISSEDKDGFISFAPEHLSFDKDYFSLQHNEVFGALSQEEYYRKLTNLDTTLCSLSPYQDRFLPFWWRDRSRRIEVIEHASSGGNDKLNIRYSDFLPGWPEVSRGDYVISLGAGSSNTLFIVEKRHSSVELEVKRYAEAPGADENKGHDLGWKGYIVKRLDPVDYLAGMHAVYIFHALFLGFGPADILDPGADHGALNPRIIDKSIELPSNKFGSNSWGLSRMVGRYKIADYAHHLYFWLSSGSFRQLDETDLKLVTKIENEISKWLDFCARVIGEDVLRNIPLNLDIEIPNQKLDINVKDLRAFAMTQEEWNKKYRNIH